MDDSSDLGEELTDGFGTFADAAPEAIFLHDVEGAIVDVNQRAVESLGYTREELLSMTVSAIESDYSQRELTAFWDGMEAGDRETVRGRHRRKDGSEVPVEHVIRKTRLDGDVMLLTFSRDITGRKRHERELERKTRAMDRAPIGISMSDPDQPDNPLVYVNEEFTDLTGYSAEEIAGRNCRFLQGEDTAPDAVARMREAIDDEEPVAVELRNYRKDGTEFWNRVTLAPITDEDGTVRNWIGFQEDVTDRRESEAALERTRAFLDDVIFSKGETGLDSAGTGIGLYLVESLVERYDGDVRVADNEPEGAVFAVELPTFD